MTRIFFAILVWTAALFVFIITGLILIPQYGIAIGSVAWLLALAYWHNLFLVSVPEVTGLATINLFKKDTLYPYTTGIHFRYPWEQVKEGNYINLRVVTQERKETYPSQDGPLMKAEWSFQYKPTVAGLPKYIAVDETTINKGLVDVGGSFLSIQIAQKKALDCKDDQDNLEKNLVKSFEEAKIRLKDGTEIGLEDFYGIDIVRVSLADLDYEEKFQKVRVSEQVATRLKTIAKNLQLEEIEKNGKKTMTKKDISDKDALNTALIINGDIKKHVQEVEGKGGEALAALLMAMSKGGKNE